MTGASNLLIEITPEVLLKAYACGIFPMAENAEDSALYWIEPERRGIVPLDEAHISRRLRRTVRAELFDIRVDHDFEAVIDGCAAPAGGRRKTWINKRIRRLYRALFEMGHCHTVEAWRDGRIVGGLYGVTLGAAFFGESMFHFERDASKVAFVHLIARLKTGGFTLLDTQFVTDHLKQFGTVEISRQTYHHLLEDALVMHADFRVLPARLSGEDVLGIIDLRKGDCAPA